MDRRLFVKLSAFSAAAISFSLLDGCKTESIQKEFASPDLLTHILEKDVLKEIGDTYLKQNYAEKNVDELISSLLLNSGITKSTEAIVIKSYLIDKTTEDFRTEKIVYLKGWILSITEARQSALFFLLQNR